jgi:hypothetical protein
MKRLIYVLFFLIGYNTYSQNYPRYFIESGDTVGVIISIDQAQKIYNNQVLLDLFVGHKMNCDSLKNRFEIVVNKYEKMQLVDKTIIEQHEKSLKDKESIIRFHQNNEKNFDMELYKCDTQNKLKDEKINNLNKIVIDLENQRKWLLGSSVGFGAFALFLLGAISIK